MNENHSQQLARVTNLLEGILDKLTLISPTPVLAADVDTPDEDDVPAWPTAPYVWWDGRVWARGQHGMYTWSDELTTETLEPPCRMEPRFAREAVPVTLVPTEAWETWKRWASPENDPELSGDRALADAVESLAREVAR